jgi:prepilin-type processing-associated H-X9-DG protein
VTIDLTGGLSDELEYVFTEQPDDPEMRESVNAWIWDDGVEFGMPRIGIEAVADQWDSHDVQLNMAFVDGRVFNIFAPGKIHEPVGADGKARVLGAGPLS